MSILEHYKGSMSKQIFLSAAEEKLYREAIERTRYEERLRLLNDVIVALGLSQVEVLALLGKDGDSARTYLNRVLNGKVQSEEWLDEVRVALLRHLRSL